MSFEPRPGIEHIVAYVGGESLSPPGRQTIRLASNELPFRPSPAVRTAMARVGRDANRYPDGGSIGLRHDLAAVHGLEADRILTGSGSEELLQYVCRAFVKDGDEVLCSRYGFMMYPIIARSVGALPVFAPEVDFRVDVDAMLAAISAATRLVFLTNPANPTGTYIPGSDLERFIEAVPEDVLVVVDEAYAEFVQAPDYASALGLARAAPNVVVTRTFSKIFGLGGLRVGWGYAPASVVDAVNRIRLPFNVNAVALAAARAALGEPERVERARSYTGDVRRWTVRRLAGLGLHCPESVTNFVLPGFPSDEGGRSASEVAALLKDGGILVRPMGAYRLPDRLRVTIGSRRDMSALIDALKDIFRPERRALDRPSRRDRGSAAASSRASPGRQA